jgi:hypothetical protein
MRAKAILLLRVLLVAGTPCAALAQHARIIGRAHALGDSSRAVPGADVTLNPGGRSTRTDSVGAFGFSDVADGSYSLRVRRLGFEVKELKVNVKGQTDSRVQVPMYASAQALGEVVIAGRRVTYPLRYAEAYARLTHENGDFLTREQIDSLHPLDLTSLLQTLPGIRVKKGALNFGRCDDSMNPFVTDGNRNNVAKIQVYLDGQRLTNYYVGDDSRDATHELRDIVPTSLQLMEVYRGPGRIPGQYLDDACAVVLLWSK